MEGNTQIAKHVKCCLKPGFGEQPMAVKPLVEVKLDNELNRKKRKKKKHKKSGRRTK